MSMTSSQPYLIRAVYEWLLDNGLTPYLAVNALLPGVEVPERHIEDGKIILNVSPRAVSGLVMNNDEVEFDARFSGIPQHIYVPVHAVSAIYAYENGRGMVFDEEAGQVTDESSEAERQPEATAPSLSSVTTSEGEGDPDDTPPASEKTETRPTKRGKPSLKVVK